MKCINIMVYAGTRSSCNPFSYHSLASIYTESFLITQFLTPPLPDPQAKCYLSPCRPLPSSLVAQVMTCSGHVRVGVPQSYCCLLPPAAHSCIRRFLGVAPKPRSPDDLTEPASALGLSRRIKTTICTWPEGSVLNCGTTHVIVICDRSSSTPCAAGPGGSSVYNKLCGNSGSTELGTG